jgi:uncharacterized protein YdeI (YjbR/CyaY-like superfamily)
MYMAVEFKQFHAKTRAQWRRWLQKNHASEHGVLLLFFKKNAGETGISYSDAVEEALCFGWIDSIKYRLDDNRSVQKFSPRKSNSKWSALNKTRIKQLIKDGAMTAAGIQKIEEAKKSGAWNELDSSDKHSGNNTLPKDLQRAFAGNKKALDNFKAFAPSYRKRFFSWLDSAKRAETRQARILHIVAMAEANKKPGAKGFVL